MWPPTVFISPLVAFSKGKELLSLRALLLFLSVAICSFVFFFLNLSLSSKVISPTFSFTVGVFLNSFTFLIPSAGLFTATLRSLLSL